MTPERIDGPLVLCISVECSLSKNIFNFYHLSLTRQRAVPCSRLVLLSHACAFLLNIRMISNCQLLILAVKGLISPRSVNPRFPFYSQIFLERFQQQPYNYHLCELIPLWDVLNQQLNLSMLDNVVFVCTVLSNASQKSHQRTLSP